MNSRLKFRAWDKKYKYMNYKVLIGNIDADAGKNWTSHAMWIDPSKVDYKCEPHWNNVDQFGDVEFMQCTGLMDNHGKEIWEGDIVSWTRKGWVDPEDDINGYRDKTDISTIEWNDHGFWIKDEGFGWEGENLWDWDKIEVIGNIYEHHLLKIQNTASTKAAKCPRCKNSATTESHNCPYQSDIHNDSETLCNCCDECTHQCAMDI